MGTWLTEFVGQRPRIALLGIAGIFALVTGVVVIASAFVALAVAVVTAVGWSVWLEQSAEPGLTRGGLGIDDGRGRRTGARDESQQQPSAVHGCCRTTS